MENYRLAQWVLIGANVKVLVASQQTCQAEPFPTVAYVNGLENVVVFAKASQVEEVLTDFHVCPRFLTLPRLAPGGGQAKASVLVHEAAHVGFGAQDVQVDPDCAYPDHWCYGKDNATNLARFYPDKAILNADNYSSLPRRRPCLEPCSSGRLEIPAGAG